ncbi:MAG: hypothetical protein J6M12_03570 [Clostridia bacterium]|nr:hypothetical protein [Clostridia bacterium]
MSDIYYDLHMEGDEPEEKSTLSKVLSIIGKTVSVTVIALIVFMLVYRMWEMKEPAGTGKYIWTAATDSAYEELKGTSTTVSSKYPEDQFSYEYESHNTVTVTKKGEDEEDKENYQRITLPSKEYYSKIGFEIFTQRLVSYRVEDAEGEEQIVNRSEYFEVKDHPVKRALRVTHVYLVPAAKQVQLTFRYKSDIYEKLNSQPFSSGLPFDFTLTDDSKDYTAFSYKTFKKGVYRYVTMVFEGVDLSNAALLTLEMDYYDTEGKQNLTMCVYDAELPVERVKVSPAKTPAALPGKED